MSGALERHYYTALNGTYVSYAADGTALDISQMTYDPAGDPIFESVTDAAPYPPLEIIAE